MMANTKEKEYVNPFGKFVEEHLGNNPKFKIETGRRGSVEVIRVKQKTKLTDFGTVELLKQTETECEFKLAGGFSGTVEDTIELMRICKLMAGGCKVVTRAKSEKGYFHLILTK